MSDIELEEGDGWVLMCPKCQEVGPNFKMRAEYSIEADFRYVRIYTGDWHNAHVYGIEDEQLSMSILNKGEGVQIGFDWDYRTADTPTRKMLKVSKLWCGNCGYEFSPEKIAKMTPVDITS